MQREKANLVGRKMSNIRNATISEKELCERVLHSLQRISDRVIADKRGFVKGLKKHWQIQVSSRPQEQKEEVRKAKRQIGGT